MAYEFEVDADFETVAEFDDSEYIAEFADPFEEEEEFRELGINPFSPTEAKPGSADKVMMLAARYAAGLPLWHDSDCYDHAPVDLQQDEFGVRADA